MSSSYKREWRKRKAALSALADSSSDEEKEQCYGDDDEDIHNIPEMEHEEDSAAPCEGDDYGYNSSVNVSSDSETEFLNADAQEDDSDAEIVAPDLGQDLKG